MGGFDCVMGGWLVAMRHHGSVKKNRRLDVRDCFRDVSRLWNGQSAAPLRVTQTLANWTDSRVASKQQLQAEAIFIRVYCNRE